GVRGEVGIQILYFFFIFLFLIYEWQKTKTDAERKKAQLEMNRLYYDAYDQLIMLVRERQHDMKNHIGAILGMIYATDNYEELAEKQKEYCGYVMEQNEKTKLVLSTGNPLISGFLYSKIQEAERKDIKIEYHIGIPKIETILPEYELIEMMSILTDNAIDALSKTDENEKDLFKEIRISLKDAEEENYIELSVANTSEYYDEDITEHFFETGYSSKGKGRGIGLSKLKRLVQDKKGDIIVSNELYDGRNYLTFTIRLPKN
ncbi:MAG: GHKL domain-containing protein, partial [Lachnospiraceae bacterium]|nr:GHKL domain-containing protein [Lachnospiraceae bacterium]